MNDYLFETLPADEAASAPGAGLVLLHGREMRADALRPFIQTLRLPLAACVPEGPCVLPDGSRSWWPAASFPAVSEGRDLVDRVPPQREAARAVLGAVLDGMRARWPGLPLVVAGFSQGGMLAMDQVLLGSGPRPDGLVLISSTRIARGEWAPHWTRVQGLPVLVLHGRQDTEIPLGAGRALHDALQQAGADVAWQEHDGGHEIPLAAWRALRRFIQARLAPPAQPGR